MQQTLAKRRSKGHDNDGGPTSKKSKISIPPDCHLKDPTGRRILNLTLDMRMLQAQRLEAAAHQFDPVNARQRAADLEYEAYSSCKMLQSYRLAINQRLKKADGPSASEQVPPPVNVGFVKASTLPKSSLSNAKAAQKTTKKKAEASTSLFFPTITLDD